MKTSMNYTIENSMKDNIEGIATDRDLKDRKENKIEIPTTQQTESDLPNSPAGKELEPHNNVEASPDSSKSEKSYIGVILMLVTAFSMVALSYTFRIILSTYDVNTHEILFLKGIHAIIFSIIGISIFKVPFLSHDLKEVKYIAWRSVVIIADNNFP